MQTFALASGVVAINCNHYRQALETLLRDGLHNVPTNCIWSIVMRQHDGGPKV